jgi:hypothetical protein
VLGTLLGTIVNRKLSYVMSTDKKLPHEEDPRETPLDDPRKRTDKPNLKQTDEPWKGYPEREQRNEADIDLEKWQESNTH